ncbi:glucose-6-phosphate isomerase [Kaarinaea lacus]
MNKFPTQAWQKLQDHYQEVSSIRMRDLFRKDPDRFNRFSLTFNDILFDYSKNLVTNETMPLLYQMAEEADLAGWIEKMFTGEKINHTEDRAVLHVALRTREKKELLVDGEDIITKVHHELNRIRKISDAIRSRRWLGCTGQSITDVVNIGIGGSDLGPKMVTEALKPYALQDLRNHFVSNLDENHINDTLEGLNPETTLFIVSSKSFSTLETKTNAVTAREWFLNAINDESQLEKHFLSVSANVQAAVDFGINPENILSMWDWVGGRYSLWSSIGLPIAIAIGMDNFEAMLSGAYEMDEHFRTAPLEKNIPINMALLGVWYNNFFKAQTHAILPYDEHMRSFPAYLQQADMESNGKSVDREGNPVNYETGPILFGEIGIKGQHAFYQLLHQGTKLVPADFLAPITAFKCIKRHHRALMSNVFAQTEALMKGRTEEEARQELVQQGLSEEAISKLLPYKIFPGNKPTNTILFYTLDPKTLGSLIAMYEQKVFVQGVIWNINSFDQWGVELGKQLANSILPELEDDKPVNSHDASTNGLINYYKKLRPRK